MATRGMGGGSTGGRSHTGDVTYEEGDAPMGGGSS